MNITSKTNKTLELGNIGFGGKLPEKPYSAVTKGVEITVWPEFIDSQMSTLGNLFIWAYHIRIDNRGLETVKLVNRHWKIIDEHGGVQEVDGEGVVGEQPLLAPGESFQYSSGVHLRHPSGIMAGHYQMQNSDGDLFDVTIPSFSLDIPSVKNVIN